MIKDYGDRTGTAIQYNSKENAIEKVPEVVAENITKLEEMYFWLKFKLAE